MTDTIFTKIIKREIPAEIIFEDEHTIVIPDKFPSMHGQVLVISKRQVPYIFDLEDTEYVALMNTTKRIAKALDAAFNTVRTAVIVEGFEVPHVHVRLYPCPSETMTLLPRNEASDSDLKEITEKIKNALH